ncbi:MAG: hypothetical protein JNK40_05075 [Chromatiales bacterium]|nr:hypothetical protein [Chromatiales bacterium]
MLPGINGGRAMLGRLQDLAIRISRTWWQYLVVLFLFIGSLQALMRIGERFPDYAGGAAPFDLQNGLQAVQVYPQIAGYTEQARELYYAFTLIDYAFPFFAGLFITATVAFALRYGAPRLYAALVARKLLPVLMLATAFDWLENAAALSAIVMYPGEVGWLPVLLVAAKKAKLGFSLASNGAMLLALLTAAGSWLARRIRR